MGPHRVRIRAGWVALPLVVWLIAACSMRWQTPLNPTLSEPLHVSRVPLTIGLYYGPELRTYELVRVRGKARIVVPIGPATVPLLDRVTPRLFEAVVPVDGLPPQGTPSFDDATLRARFIDADDATSLVIELPLTGLGYHGPSKAPR